MTLKMANNAWSTLASAINTSASTLTVQSATASLFPELAVGEWCPITVVDAAGNMEIMKCTARVGAALTVVRAQEGTTATAFDVGSSVSVRLTKVAIETFMAEALAPATSSAAAAEASAAAAWNAQAMTADLMSSWRNKIINGDFIVRQRTPASIAAGAAGYATDRIKIINGTNVAVVPSIAALSLGQTDIPGQPKFCMRLTFAVAPTSGTIKIEQPIESVLTFADRVCTMRGYFTGPTGDEELAASLVQHFGIGTGASADVEVTPTSLDIATIYSAISRKRNAVFNLPSLTGKEIEAVPTNTAFVNTRDALIARWTLTPRQVGAYDFAHWSLVEGDVSGETDPFAGRPIQQELALCQRYFEAGMLHWNGDVISEKPYRAWADFKVPKRGTYNVNTTPVDVVNFSTTVYFNERFLTGFRHGRQANGSGFGEILMNFTADAEF